MRVQITGFFSNRVFLFEVMMKKKSGKKSVRFSLADRFEWDSFFSPSRNVVAVLCLLWVWSVAPFFTFSS